MQLKLLVTFVNNNSSLIKNIASTVEDVSKAGATTASSIKQIVDLVKQNKALKQVPQPSSSVTTTCITDCIKPKKFGHIKFTGSATKPNCRFFRCWL
jgi:hypothetical protein